MTIGIVVGELTPSLDDVSMSHNLTSHAGISARRFLLALVHNYLFTIIN